VGRASGEQRALVAAREAMSGPLLEGSINGARAILFNVAGSSELSLFEVTEAAEAIRSAADPHASVIFGASFDESLGDEVRVTVVATGFEPAPTDEPGAIRGLAQVVAGGPTAVDATTISPPTEIEPVAVASARSAVDVDDSGRRPRVRRAAELASRLLEVPPSGGPKPPLGGDPPLGAEPIAATRSEAAPAANPADLEVPSFLRRQRRRPSGGFEARPSTLDQTTGGPSAADASTPEQAASDTDR